MNRNNFNEGNKSAENENINILYSELDFENINFLLSSLKEIFQLNNQQNTNTNLLTNSDFTAQHKSQCNQDELIKNFHSHLNLQKFLFRSNHLKENEKTQISKRSKLIQAYVIISLWRLNLTKKLNLYSHNANLNQDFSKTQKFQKIISGSLKEILNSIEMKEISHTIFSHFIDESSFIPDDFDSNSFDQFLNLILSPLLGDNLNFKYIISLVDKNSENPNSQNSNLNFTFEIFLIYFRYIALFFLLSERMKQLFDVLDKENKSKILTVEFIICGKKIKRNIAEDNMFSQLLTKIMDSTDTNEVHITKTQFFNLLLNSIVNF